MTEVVTAPNDIVQLEPELLVDDGSVAANAAAGDADTDATAVAAPASSANGDVSPAPPGTTGTEGDHDSGVDENTQSANDHAPTKKASSAAKDGKSATRRTGTRSTSRSKSFTREEEPPKELAKKVPMNKVEVGKGPSPNLKSVKSKIGSMENTHYKPGGGNVRIEHKKVEIGEVKPKVGAKNEAYQPSAGGQKKLFKPPPKQEVEQPPTPAPPATATEKKPVKKQFVTTQKLNWSAKSKIGSLENAKYKPKGGDKKIETVKLNFKDKAQSKVASTVNIKHKPGGGEVKTSEKTPEKPTEDEKIAEETPEPLQTNGNTADHV